jgi:MerR family transcriptional regulator, thiopeptide resistance regulator
MSERHTYQVRDVARLSGVSVRALHHYDEIGLLRPSGRSGAGYRLYSDADLLRLQQILVGRELGLSLVEIRRSLDDPRFDRRTALAEQRRQLLERIDQTARMVRAIDTALGVVDPGGLGETMDRSTLFEGFDPAKYETEVKERWAETDAYRESKRRRAGMTADDWRQANAEQATVYVELAAEQAAGRGPEDPVVAALVERHRLAIDRWFYPCSPEMHGRLADLYESDARFAATIDGHGQGLTPFLVAAIRAAGR